MRRKQLIVEKLNNTKSFLECAAYRRMYHNVRILEAEEAYEGLKHLESCDDCRRWAKKTFLGIAFLLQSLKKKSEERLKLNEPFWKNDLVKRIRAYARSLGYEKALPEGLADLIHNIRARCDRCGILKAGMTHYQCCWVKTSQEDYCPLLCDTCHSELVMERPHATVSV